MHNLLIYKPGTLINYDYKNGYSIKPLNLNKIV
jgi:hypothetical protein